MLVNKRTIIISIISFIIILFLLSLYNPYYAIAALYGYLFITFYYFLLNKIYSELFKLKANRAIFIIFAILSKFLLLLSFAPYLLNENLHPLAVFIGLVWQKMIIYILEIFNL